MTNSRERNKEVILLLTDVGDILQEKTYSVSAFERLLFDASTLRNSI